MDIEGTIEFILQSQARAEGRMEKAELRMQKADRRAERAELRMERAELRTEKTDKRIDSIAAIIRQGMRMLAKTQAALAEISQAQKRTDRELAELARAQKATERSLKAFMDSLRHGRNGQGR